MSSETVPTLDESRAAVPRLSALRAERAAAAVAPRSAVSVGQLPAAVDLTVYQGDDLFINITVDDSVAPIDLTTYSPSSEIRSAPGGALVCTFVATVVDATHIQLHLTSAESAKVIANGSWDVQIEDANGVVTTLAYGKVTLIKQVTL